MSDRETIRIALYDAIGWQESLADAYGDKDDPERKDALKQAEKYRSILRRRYGVNRKPDETLLDGCKTVTLSELRARHT